MSRRITTLIVLLAAPLACVWALPRHTPVPGGVAVLALGDADDAQPLAVFNGLPQPVLRHKGRWLALVGLPLDIEPGNHPLRVEVGGVQRTLPIAVGEIRYWFFHQRPEAGQNNHNPTKRSIADVCTPTVPALAACHDDSARGACCMP